MPDRPPSFRVRPIGWVRRADPPNAPGVWFDPFAESVLEILPRWSAALEGLEDYSHLIVLFWFDRAQRPRSPRPVRPEGREEAPAVGLFATRTPRRPNPIGLACPRLLRREGNRLIVSGLDAWDATPILDLKGYAPRDDARPEATVPDWLSDLWRRHDEERAGEA